MSKLKIAVRFSVVTASLIGSFYLLGSKQVAPMIVPVTAHKMCDTPQRNVNAVIDENSRHYGFDPEFVRAIMTVESRGDVMALGPNRSKLQRKHIQQIDDMLLRLVSITDFGPLQLSGYEGLRLGLTPQQLCDPRETIDAALYLLRDCWQRVKATKQHSRLELTAACHNGGLGNYMKPGPIAYGKEVVRVYRSMGV